MPPSFLVVLAAGLALAGVPDREALVRGELVRVNHLRRSVTLKTGEKVPREIEVSTDAATSVVSRGRALRLEDLRTGEPLEVLLVEGVRPLKARVLKAGASRYAVSSPPPPPSPRP